jgi:hypothetical protein
MTTRLLMPLTVFLVAAFARAENVVAETYDKFNDETRVVLQVISAGEQPIGFYLRYTFKGIKQTEPAKEVAIIVRTITTAPHREMGARSELKFLADEKDRKTFVLLHVSTERVGRNYADSDGGLCKVDDFSNLLRAQKLEMKFPSGVEYRFANSDIELLREFWKRAELK